MNVDERGSFTELLKTSDHGQFSVNISKPGITKGQHWHHSRYLAECGLPKERTYVTGSPMAEVLHRNLVEEVYFGAGGILENAPDHAIVADMTTSSPGLAEKIYEAAKAKGLRALDAPVSGGDSGAKNGTLAIMVGGQFGTPCRESRLL